MITIESLSFSYPDSFRTVFDRISASFLSGWTAIIGPNGSGKTTLLRLIAGKLTPEEGKIQLDGQLSYCPQDQEEMPTFFSDPDIMNRSETFALMSRLGINDDWPFRWGTLSGGEKKKCQIADALLRQPQALLLDEPANHIDASTIRLLSEELKRYSGIGIVVSHDLAFLDALCTRTILLTPTDNGSRIRSIPISPREALEEERSATQAMLDSKRNLNREIESLSAVQRQKQRDIVQDRKRLSKADVSSKDKSTKAKIDAARLTGKDRKAGDAVSRIASRLEQMRSDLDDLGSVSGKRKTGARLQGTCERRANILSIASGTTELLDGVFRLVHPDLTISPTSRIAITGDNGAGKSSFMDFLSRSLSIPSDRLWLGRQELSTDERRNVKLQIDALDNAQLGSVLSVVYRLGSEPTAIMSTKIPSPGETRKLLFGLAMLRQVSVILLDEPTNHLDIQSIQAWGDAFAEFAGAAIVITHDRAFIERFAEEIWHITRHGDTASLEVSSLHTPTS